MKVKLCRHKKSVHKFKISHTLNDFIADSLILQTKPRTESDWGAIFLFFTKNNFQFLLAWNEIGAIGKKL